MGCSDIWQLQTQVAAMIDFWSLNMTVLDYEVGPYRGTLFPSQQVCSDLHCYLIRDRHSELLQ